MWKKLDNCISKRYWLHSTFLSCSYAVMVKIKKYLCLNIDDEDGTTVIAEISEGNIKCHAAKQNSYGSCLSTGYWKKINNCKI